MSTMSDGVPHEIITVDIRKTHPTLYALLMIISLGFLALSYNFFFLHPTFDPYQIPKAFVGFVYLVLGVSRLLILNRWRVIRWIRISQAFGIGWGFFWAFANLQQFFNGGSSIQLPIVLGVLFCIEIILIREPLVNPLTERAK